MNTDQARRYVVLSALVVGGVWAYRRYKEGPASVMQAPEFLVAWGATFFVLAVLSEPAPRFAGMMAILVGTGDLLANGAEISKLTQQGLKATQQASKTASKTASKGTGGSTYDQTGQSGIGHR